MLEQLLASVQPTSGCEALRRPLGRARLVGELEAAAAVLGDHQAGRFVRVMRLLVEACLARASPKEWFWL